VVSRLPTKSLNDPDQLTGSPAGETDATGIAACRCLEFPHCRNGKKNRVYTTRPDTVCVVLRTLFYARASSDFNALLRDHQAAGSVYSRSFPKENRWRTSHGIPTGGSAVNLWREEIDLIIDQVVCYMVLGGADVPVI